MGEIGEYDKNDSTRSKFLWDEKNFKNINYILLNEINSWSFLKWVLNDFPRLIIIKWRNLEILITYSLFTKISLKLHLVSWSQYCSQIFKTHKTSFNDLFNLKKYHSILVFYNLNDHLMIFLGVNDHWMKNIIYYWFNPMPLCPFSP